MEDVGCRISFDTEDVWCVEGHTQLSVLASRARTCKYPSAIL